MTQNTADIICRESTNSSAFSFTSIPINSSNYDFPIFGYSFNCTGYEDSLCDCPNVTNSCPNMEIVQITCYTPGKDIRKKYMMP